MSFLEKLGEELTSQFALGENTTRKLNVDLNFDKSEERRYVENGFLRKDPYNTDPKKLEILFSEPNATVLLKKKFFSSIGENFRPDFMDKDELLYYKAMQVLFQNKCRQISALEKLSKIHKVTSVFGKIDEQLLPIIITLADTIGGNSDTLGFGSPLGNTSASAFNQTVDRLRKIYSFNNTNNYTTWIGDNANLFQSTVGQGTGVIELTTFSQITTTTSVNINSPGTFNLTLSDPYECMLITEYDIERAIADATNTSYKHKTFQHALVGINEVILNTKNQLNELRSLRKASPISFKVNPDTLLNKRVIAILDRTGTEIIFDYSGGLDIFGAIDNTNVKVDVSYLKDGDILGFDGLDTKKTRNLDSKNDTYRKAVESELSVFSRLVNAIFNKITLEANSKNAFQITNKNTNYARRKLRFNFAGNLIIQAMDSIHVYINSKSRYDNNIMTGISNAFTGFGILQNVNKTVTDLKNTADSLFHASGSAPMQIEKSIYVGNDFPNQLWNMIRGQFVSEKEGTHVFAGVVENAKSSWSDGNFTVNVSGSDNTFYFKQGTVNFKPGMDTFNGSFYDPLTPFKSKFDTNGKEDLELLEENKFLLGNGEKSLVKYKSGANAGTKMNSVNYINDQSVDPLTGRITKTFHAADGLVYKWKEGIGVFTQFGSSTELNNINKVGAANTFAEPFAGLDIMNVLSLLIAGVPYNFASYFRATQNINNASNDPQTNKNSANSFQGLLKRELNTSNALWGNFIPFKNLVMDEKTFVQALNGQLEVTKKNQQLDDMIQELNILNKKTNLFAAANLQTNSQFKDIAAKTNEQAQRLQETISSTIREIQKENTLTNDHFGLDNSFESFLENDPASKSASNPEIRRNLRRQLNYLTRRMSYDVRANEDKNLFVVDDFYDKDFDIIAFNQGINNEIKIYNNEFTSVKEKIALVANLLNLEVFADTQGHIRVRPPQYNRMPSSVFYKMMYLKKAYQIQIFPEFLNDLFGNQLDTLKTTIEIIEDEIRLLTAILGYKTNSSDTEALKFIRSSTATDGTSYTFSFVSNTDGFIIDTDILLEQANPETLEDTNSFATIQNQVNAGNNNFTNAKRYSAILKEIEKQNLAEDGFSTNSLDAGIVTDLISRIQTKSGQRISKTDYVNPKIGIEGVEFEAQETVDVFKVINDIAKKIQERQKTLKLFYNTLKNASEFRSLDEREDISNELLFQGNFGNSNIPEVFEHMIEDEKYDDYGLNSGKRYIIKRSQIKSISINETPPDFVAVQVQGVMNNFAPDSVITELNSLPAGGNALTSAVAVDYDLWRRYGFKMSPPVNVPFLSNPELQCAPYANVLLSQNRKNILRGDITIVGNEFMQPGEVVFLEDRGMLFYVNKVNHNLSMSGKFETRLEVSYGHSPGDYIPTVMDSIGKIIYKNRDLADLTIHRQESSGNDIDIGVVQKYNTNKSVVDIAQSETTTTDTSKAISDLFHDSDVKVINNILFRTNYYLNGNVKNNNYKIEIRIYHDNANVANPDLKDLADVVRQVLVGERDDLDKKLGKNKNVTIDKKASVSVVPINLDDKDDRRSPSQKAIAAARNRVGEVSSFINTGDNLNPSEENNKLRKALFNSIIDCWIVIENKGKDE